MKNEIKPSLCFCIVALVGLCEGIKLNISTLKWIIKQFIYNKAGQWDSFPTVSIRAKVNSKYVTAGDQSLIASRTSVTSLNLNTYNFFILVLVEI